MYREVVVEGVFQRRQRWKMKSLVASHWKLTTTKWEQSSKLMLLQLHKKLPKNSTSIILWSFSIWSKLKGEKSPLSGCLISWPKIKNTVVLKCHLFILCNNKEPFLDQIVTCNEKHILYNNHWQPAQWLDQKEVPKHFSKPNLHQKMVIVTLWWSAANLIHYSFLNASRIIPFEKYTQQISEMYWKLQCFQQNGPNSSPRQRPTAHHTTNASEIKRVELWSFALPAIFSWPHTNWSPLLQASRKLFAGKHFHNQ